MAMPPAVPGEGNISGLPLPPGDDDVDACSWPVTAADSGCRKLRLDSVVDTLLA